MILGEQFGKVVRKPTALSFTLALEPLRVQKPATTATLGFHSISTAMVRVYVLFIHIDKGGVCLMTTTSAFLSLTFKKWTGIAQNRDDVLLDILHASTAWPIFQRFHVQVGRL